VPFHALRHTFASLAIQAGEHPKAIQAALGHASWSITMNVYGHLMPNAFRGLGARLERLVSADPVPAVGSVTR
jgi:integrase